VARAERSIEGFRVRVDERLLPGGADDEVGRAALAFLAAKLADVRIVVPADKLERLRQVTIVLDASCGDLHAMQYHPSGDWLEANGYPRDLEKCVHLPRAADVATRRNVNEQPWVVLHELAHAYHDQVLGFDEPRSWPPGRPSRPMAGHRPRSSSMAHARSTTASPMRRSFSRR
jgi:hypothetical protein